jgi:hypothetical protein
MDTTHLHETPQVLSEEQAILHCKAHEKDLAEISNALADITIKNGLDSTVVLWGVQAFLMGMVTTGRADRIEVGVELHRMSGYWLQADC